MKPEDYSPEQRADIERRVEKAKTMLTELHLMPSCQLYLTNIGDDMFATKAIPYLQDTLFSAQLSPLQDV